jgi:hypothetical protein
MSIIRRCLLPFLLALGLVFGTVLLPMALTTPAAGAPVVLIEQASVEPAGDPGPIIVGDAPSDTTADVTFSVPWAVYITGSLIPLVVAFMAQSTWGETWKGRINLLLSFVTAALTVFIDNGGSAPLLQVLSAGTATLVVSLGSYYTFWKGGGLQQKLLAIGGGNQPIKYGS